MKHLKIIFNGLKTALTVLFFCLSNPVWAEPADLSSMDSVEVSLLTCQPHDEVYSLYGHTAIRYHDLRAGGIDVAFNYGVFNYKKSFFVIRFVFGLTDYELGVFPFDLFMKEYQYFGSKVTEQVLNLNNEEKMQLRLALAENMLPENVVYRYNYFYNNCTTKARDIIEQCISGRVIYDDEHYKVTTYRETIHAMTADNPWARFGDDLLLGIQADLSTTMREQEFLPENLMNDFDHAIIRHNDIDRPLVKERRTVVPAGLQITQAGFPLSPLVCGLILLSIGAFLSVIQYRQKCTYRWYDVSLMLLTGIIGFVLFLMLFSSHPTVSINLQLLLFNPLPWFFLWPVIKGKATRYWIITLTLCCTFFIGYLFQSYAEGLWCLALCLLLQSYLHIRLSR